MMDPNAQVPPLMKSYSERKCRDVIWIVLFVAYWIGMVGVTIVSMKSGDPARLLYGVDSEGNQCGGTGSECFEGQECGKVIAYPRIDKDIANAVLNGVDISNPTSLLSIPFYSVCLTSCPEGPTDSNGDGEVRDWVCSYNASKLLNEETDMLEFSPEVPSASGRALLETCLEQKSQFNGVFAEYALSEPCRTLMGECFKSYVTEKDLFFRCVPQNVDNSTCTNSPYLESINKSVTRIDKGDGTWETRPASDKQCGECIEPVTDSDGNPIDPGSKECKVKVVTSSSESVQVQINPLFEQVNSWTAQLIRWMGDINLCLFEILLAGAGGAVLLGCFWLVLLRFFAGVFVWATLWGLLIVFLYLSIQFLMYGGVISSEMISSFISDTTNSSTSVELGSIFSEQTQSEMKMYEICGYVMTGITVIYMVIVIAMMKRIRLAVQVLKEATKAICTMPMILLFPIMSVAFSLALTVYCFGLALYISSSGEISPTMIPGYNLTMSNSTLGTVRRLSNITDATATLADSIVQEFQSSSLNTYFFLFNLFGFLWTNQVIAAISCTTIAGAVASWYWASVEESEKKSKMPASPVLASLKRVIRFHLGSMIFGAFIIALVQFIRVLLAYLDKQTQNLQKKNKVIMVIMKVVQCCLWCFEKILKFVSKNAFIMVAIHGTSFCTSTKNAFGILFSNMARIGVATAINNLLILLAKLVITVGSSALTWFLVNNSDKAPSSVLVPVFATSLISWFVGDAFLRVYGLAVDTIMISVCEDEKRHDGSPQKPFYMSKSLLKIVNKSNKAYKKAQEVEDADEGSQRSIPVQDATPEKKVSLL